MKHRPLYALAAVALLASAAGCLSTETAPVPAPAPTQSVEITAEPTEAALTKEERIEAAQESEARQSRPTEREAWLTALDDYWAGLASDEQAALCDSWRTLGNRETHELIEAPDTIAAVEVGMKFEDDLCVDFPG